MGTVAELVQNYLKQDLDCGSSVSAHPVEHSPKAVNPETTDDVTFCDKKNLIQQSKDFAAMVNEKLSGSKKESKIVFPLLSSYLSTITITSALL